MEKTITSKFIDSMWEFSQKSVSKKIIEEVKCCLIDYIACANIGATLLEKQDSAFSSAFGSAMGNCSVVGSDKKVNVLVAAMLNGLDSHWIELDDGQRYAMLHLGAPVISAMLAVSQDKNLSAVQFIRGVVVGYEATVRIASAIQPGHKLKWYHATGTCGTIGTSIGIAAALEYGKDKWNTVISCAATDAAGLLQMIDDGSELKPYNVGRAAVAAINAAYMGATGLTGPGDPLGGKRGFFAATADEVKEKYLLEGFGEKLAIETIYRKPYAACRHCHAPIEATLNIINQNKIDIDTISKIVVDTYGLAVKGHEHTEIDGAGSAKMSTPYAVAAAIVFGKVSYQEYEDRCLGDVKVHSLMEKVSVVENTELSKLAPAKRVAIVTIVTDNGTFDSRVDYPLGEPENPISYEALKEKYFSLMNASGRSQEYMDSLIGCIENLEAEFSKFLSII